MSRTVDTFAAGDFLVATGFAGFAFVATTFGATGFAADSCTGVAELLIASATTPVASVTESDGTADGATREGVVGEAVASPEATRSADESQGTTRALATGFAEDFAEDLTAGLFVAVPRARTRRFDVAFFVAAVFFGITLDDWPARAVAETEQGGSAKDGIAAVFSEGRIQRGTSTGGETSRVVSSVTRGTSSGRGGGAWRAAAAAATISSCSV